MCNSVFIVWRFDHYPKCQFIPHAISPLPALRRGKCPFRNCFQDSFHVLHERPGFPRNRPTAASSRKSSISRDAIIARSLRRISVVIRVLQPTRALSRRVFGRLQGGCWARPPTASSQVLQSNNTAAGYVRLQDLASIHSHPSQSSKKKVRSDSE